MKVHVRFSIATISAIGLILGLVAVQLVLLPVPMPAHGVVLGGFWIDRIEVSTAHHRRCMQAGGLYRATRIGRRRGQ